MGSDEVDLSRVEDRSEHLPGFEGSVGGEEVKVEGIDFEEGRRLETICGEGGDC